MTVATWVQVTLVIEENYDNFRTVIPVILWATCRSDVDNNKMFGRPILMDESFTSRLVFQDKIRTTV